MKINHEEVFAFLDELRVIATQGRNKANIIPFPIDYGNGLSIRAEVDVPVSGPNAAAKTGLAFATWHFGERIFNGGVDYYAPWGDESRAAVKRTLTDMCNAEKGEDVP